MKTTPALHAFTIIVLVFYGFYALSTMGMTGLLFSAALGFFIYAYAKQFEIAAMGAVLGGVVIYTLTTYFARNRKEGFTTDTPEVIAKRISQITRPPAARVEPEGIFASNFVTGFSEYDSKPGVSVEGFANPDEDKKEETTPKKEETATAESKPAPATEKEIPKENFKNGASASSITNVENNTAADLNFLFKPGELPTEKKGGYHIDAGTTIMNAMKSLQPSQIEAMTADTQKLMETQKGLLEMLNTMKPMLADVKPLMETFGGLFNTK